METTVFNPIQRHLLEVGVDGIEGVLLQNDEVDELRFPETLVVFDGHAVFKIYSILTFLSVLSTY